MKKKFCPDVDIKDKFFVYILEEYKAKKQMTGKDAFALFEKSGARKFIYDFYESLHTQSTENTILDWEETFGI